LLLLLLLLTMFRGTPIGWDFVLQATNERVTKLTRELASVVDLLEEVTGQMKARGSDMTDTSPLVLIKEGLSKLKVGCCVVELSHCSAVVPPFALECSVLFFRLFFLLFLLFSVKSRRWT